MKTTMSLRSPVANPRLEGRGVGARQPRGGAAVDLSVIKSRVAVEEHKLNRKA